MWERRSISARSGTREQSVACGNPLFTTLGEFRCGRCRRIVEVPSPHRPEGEP
jgi:hypothetical protein